MIDHATEIVKELLLREKDINIAVDMTSGNGHDSKFILDKLKPKKTFCLWYPKNGSGKYKKFTGW